MYLWKLPHRQPHRPFSNLRSAMSHCPPNICLPSISIPCRINWCVQTYHQDRLLFIAIIMKISFAFFLILFMKFPIYHFARCERLTYVFSRLKFFEVSHLLPCFVWAPDICVCVGFLQSLCKGCCYGRSLYNTWSSQHQPHHGSGRVERKKDWAFSHNRVALGPDIWRPQFSNLDLSLKPLSHLHW